MKHELINLFNKILTGLIAILALFGCKSSAKTPSQNEIAEEPVCVYGIPTSYYKVHGVVTDQSDKPVEGIQVQVFMTTDGNKPEDEREYDIVFLNDADKADDGSPCVITNSEGKYDANGIREFGSPIVKVTFFDPMNRYAKDSVVTSEPAESQSGSWEKEFEYVINAKLKKAAKKQKNK
ncbi:MAG TPA: hypothetical protein DEO38_03715 [Bacteroidales bacterium]|nr:hypothetical protein [Bacteroidales bacterium]